MKLSILLVTFNHEKYIKDGLDGILIQQTTFPCEIIIADDCSTDKTLEIIEETLMSQQKLYKLIKGTCNVGMYKNYQRGFEACHGEYVAILEGDDYWTDPYRLAKHVAFLDAHRECTLSFNRYAAYYQVLSRFEVSGDSRQEDFFYVTTSMLAERNLIGNFSTCVARNSAIKKISPDFYELPFADWKFGMVMGQFGLLAKLKDVMSVYRIHGSGQWSGLSVFEQQQRLVRAIDKNNEYFNFIYNDEFLRHKARVTAESVPAREAAASTPAKETRGLLVFVVRLVKMTLPSSLRLKIKKILISDS